VGPGDGPDAARDGRTTVPLDFQAAQSFFVVFRAGTGARTSLSAASRAASGKAADKSVRAPLPGEGRGQDEPLLSNFPCSQIVAELSGSWEVAFDPKWGGPERVTFDTLQDWSKRPEDGIRFYSGTAVYRKSFDAPKVPRGQRMYLDLGTVKNLARVRLNGHDLGVVWCAPWRVEITGAVKPTGNQLEIDVANLWPNRLIGDQSLPAAKRRYSTERPGARPTAATR